MEDFNKADVAELPDLTGDAAVSQSVETETPPEKPEETPPAGSEELTEDQAEGSEGAVAPEGETGTESTDTPADEIGSPAGEQKPVEPETPSNDDFLSEMSEGRIKNDGDFNGLLSHYDELVEAAQNPEMFLPEGKAREAFKYAMQFPGDNVAAANQSFHHIMSLNPESLTPKDLQFEAYLLKEENADLLDNPARARELFEREYEVTYGEEIDSLKENDPVLYRKHEIASNQAAGMIKDLQTKFQSETPADDNEFALSPEQEQAYVTAMDEALNDFDGVTLNFSEDAEGMNFILDDQAQQSLQQSARNPGEWLEGVIGKHVDKQGNLDANSFAQEMMLMQNAGKIADQAYQQGLNDAKIQEVEEKRNVAGEVTGETPGTPPETFIDAFDKAMNG